MLRKLISFLGIGVANTLVHALTVIALIEGTACHPVLANVAGFFLANTFSYFANSCWNFGVQASVRRYTRFLLVSLVGLALTILLSAAAVAAGWHYLLGVVLISATMPLLTFLTHWKWTFKLR